MSDTISVPEPAKAKALANGIEVWCAHERLVPVGKLKSNPRNPNRHPDAQLELLAKNIKYFGWRHCIRLPNAQALSLLATGDFKPHKSSGLRWCRSHLMFSQTPAAASSFTSK